MSRFLKAALIIFVVALGFELLTGHRPTHTSRAPLIPVNPEASDPCATTDQCLAVYVAPWCGTCRTALPLIKAVREYSLSSHGKLGMKIIIGQDTPEALLTHAAELGDNTYLDTSGEFFKEMQPWGVPTWWLWDRTGSVVGMMSGSLSGEPTQKLVEEMVFYRLKAAPFSK